MTPVYVAVVAIVRAEHVAIGTTGNFWDSFKSRI